MKNHSLDAIKSMSISEDQREELRKMTDVDRRDRAMRLECRFELRSAIDTFSNIVDEKLKASSSATATEVTRAISKLWANGDAPLTKLNVRVAVLEDNQKELIKSISHISDIPKPDVDISKFSGNFNSGKLYDKFGRWLVFAGLSIGILIGMAIGTGLIGAKDVIQYILHRGNPIESGVIGNG